MVIHHVSAEVDVQQEVNVQEDGYPETEEVLIPATLYDKSGTQFPAERSETSIPEEDLMALLRSNQSCICKDVHTKGKEEEAMSQVNAVTITDQLQMPKPLDLTQIVKSAEG